jgi:hypothetical protein
LSSIQPNEPDSAWKKHVSTSEQKGVKDDVWIFRKVAQSKGNYLPFIELKKKARNNSIYQTLDRLSPRVDYSLGKYLFCYDDLVKDHETDEAREKELDKLVRKLEELYNHFLQWHNWKEVKLVVKHKSKDGNKIVALQFNKNNSIILRLVPNAKKDVDKAILIFRKGFEPTDDITKYTRADSLLRWFALVGKNNNRLPSFKIRKQYVILHIPLIPKSKGRKLYFKTLSEESYSNLYSRGHLDRAPTEKDQNLRMNIKGLLSYALSESDYEELDKSLKSLAESDVYLEANEAIERYDELGQTVDYPIYFNYIVKRDFPFLAYYDDLKQILPPDFAAKVIKSIAVRLNHKDGIKILARQYLRYITTKLFFREITSEVQNNNLNNKSFQAFRSEITAYLGHLEQRASIQEKNLEILSDIEGRRSLLMERLAAIIKSCENCTNNEVIPIYKMISESRLSWSSTSKVLTSVTERFGKRYIVTDRCLISRSKANELKPLLKNEPTYDDACLSLVNNGVPRQCISEDLFHKLGLQSALKNSISIIRKKEPPQRSKIHVIP